jgi:tetratricopeptide (TPR) repeat protein
MWKWRLIAWSFAAAAYALAGAAPLSAQSNDLAFCRGDDPDAIKRLTACNRFIEGKGKKSGKEMAAAYNARGLILAGRGFRDKAIADYSAAIKASPNEAAFYINRSTLYIQSKQYDQAIADATRAIALAPDAEAGYYNRGRAHYEKNDCSPAIPDLSESIRLDPDFGGTYTLRAYCYDKLGELKKALADYDRAFSLGKPNATTYSNRGTTLIRLGHFDRGVRDLNEALRQEPDNPRTLANRGYGLRELGEFEPALADFNAAIARDPQRAYYYIERSLVLARTNRDTEAIADLKRALELESDNPVAQALLPRIEAKLSAPGNDPTSGPKKAAARPDAGAPGKAETTVPPQPRGVALVIGNSKYKFAGALANPANDATDIAKALRALGFEVVEGLDLDLQAMAGTLREFTRKLETATIGIAFYAGHGLQVNGKNYLLPTDARIRSADTLDADAVDMARILAAMESKSRVSLIFLDACRDNPTARSLAPAAAERSRGGPVARSDAPATDVEPGLAATKGAAGTLIAYSTQPDNVALDGDGRNSPFAMALLKRIATPGLEIESMMKQVRLDVIAATQNRQVPWGHSSLVGNVYLKGR